MANFPRYDGHLYIDAYSGNIVRDFTIGTTLSIGSSATVGGTLGVTGATTLSSTLGVTGATTLSSTLSVTGNITTTVGNLIASSGDLSITNDTASAHGLTITSANVLGQPSIFLTESTGKTTTLKTTDTGLTEFWSDGNMKLGYESSTPQSLSIYAGAGTDPFASEAFQVATTNSSGTTFTDGTITFNASSDDIDFIVNTSTVSNAFKIDSGAISAELNLPLTTKSDVYMETANYTGLTTPGIRINHPGDKYDNRLLTTFYNDFAVESTSFTGVTPALRLNYASDTLTIKVPTTFDGNTDFASGTTVDFTGATVTGLTTGGTSWQTTAKTANFTAVAGEGYFVNTNGGAVTMTLPASPSGGDEVKVVDYSGDFNTNNLTITSASENIRGTTDDYTASLDREGISLVYSDATQGWQVFSYAKDEAIGAPVSFVAATGGTITTDGDYKVHTFNSSGTFTITDAGSASGSNTFDVLIVAGGGGGGSINAGGGGAGGFNYQTGISAVAQAYTVTIGGGGPGSPGGPLSGGTPLGTDGTNTDFTGQTSAVGGGRGGQYQDGVVAGNAKDGQPGGSGGGAGNRSTTGIVGTGTVGQGNDGGLASNSSPYGGGGGGGASAAGLDATPGLGGAAGNGGDGTLNSITGGAVVYSGGGGGGTYPGYVAGTGGLGGGGAGGVGTGTGTDGTANLGGGGGAGGYAAPNGSLAGNGGSGLVRVRYKFQ